jgi:hypothetical protein
MTWPNVLPNSAAFDSNADSVAASRPELKKMSDAVNILASNVYTGLATSGTVTPDAADGEIQVVTLSGNMTINAFANPVAGQIIKIIFKQPAAGATFDLSSTIPFENGIESLTPLNGAKDMATITFDGADYYGVMINAFGFDEVYPFEFNVVGDDSSGDSLQIGSIGGSTLQFVGSGGTTVSVGAGPVVTIDAGGGGGSPLAADFDVNNFKIVNNVTNGNIVLQPNGTGDVQLNADTLRVGDSNTNATITTNGTGDLTLHTNSGTNSGFIRIEDGVDGRIRLAAIAENPFVIAPRLDLEYSTGNIILFPNTTISGSEVRICTAGAGDITLKGVKWPTAAGSTGQFLKLTSSTAATWGNFDTFTSDLNLNGNDIKNIVGGTYQYTSLSVEQLDLYTTNGLFVLRRRNSDDPVIITTGNTDSPDSAGGDLNHDLCLQTTGSNTVGGTFGTTVGYILIESGNNNNIRIVPHGTGAIVCNDKVLRQVEFKDYAETVYNAGNVTGSFSVTVANGNTQRMRLTGNVTFTGFTDAREGQTVTLFLTQDGTGGRTFAEGLDSAGRMLFAAGDKTLTATALATDVMSISFVGGTYWGSLNKNYS